MVVTVAREQLIAAIQEKLAALDIETLQSVLEFIEVKEYAAIMDNLEPRENYRADQDGLIGMFSGPTDLSERVEEILYGRADDSASSAEQK